MRILFTNDDGYDSQGLHAVADLFKDDNEIAVVAPDYQRSGASHSLTLKPNMLTCKKIEGYGYDVYAVGGTPVDCVKFARNCVFKKPDLVISGINRGENLGSDIWYSGTVSAAVDAAHSGLRAIALSAIDHKADKERLSGYARFIKNNLSLLMEIELLPKTILNINFPKGDPQGVKVVKMNTQETFIDGYDKQSGDTYIPSGYRDYSLLDKDSDEFWGLNGYITITPLMIDRTEYRMLDMLKDRKYKL